MFGKPKPPSAKEVTLRALALREIIAHGLAMPLPDARKAFREKWSKGDWQKAVKHHVELSAPRFKDIRSLGVKLSPWEKTFSTTTLETVTDQQQIEASWRAESLRVLLWSLGVADKLLPYDQQEGHELLKSWPDADFTRFRRSAKLRDRTEIEQAHSVAELWHWRSRTRQLSEQGFTPPTTPEGEEPPTLDAIVRKAAKAAHEKGDMPAPVDGDFPFEGKAYRDLDAREYSLASSIAMERHFAFNWLCGHARRNQWDQTPTDT